MSAWKQAFDVINLALGAINAFGNTPGVNLIPYVSTVAAAAGALKAGINAAVNIAPYVAAITNTFSGGLPTPAELAALDAKIAELEALVAAPLPPKEDGEED